jgi:hypothetical protein
MGQDRDGVRRRRITAGNSSRSPTVRPRCCSCRPKRQSA